MTRLEFVQLLDKRGFANRDRGYTQEELDEVLKCECKDDFTDGTPYCQQCHLERRMPS